MVPVQQGDRHGSNNPFRKHFFFQITLRNKVQKSGKSWEKAGLQKLSCGVLCRGIKYPHLATRTGYTTMRGRVRASPSHKEETVKAD